MTAKLKIVGKKFNSLLVLRESDNRRGQKTRWVCLCDCGKESTVIGSNLTNGHTKTCGCARKYSPGYDEFGKKTRLYRIWSAMKGRCSCKSNAKYSYYGGQGVTVCQEWVDDFVNFYNWAIKNGYSDKLTIDRKNPFGNYEPSNCRWATSIVQGVNKKRKPSTGVSWNKRRQSWRARVNLQGKEVFSSAFKDYDEAVAAVVAARHKYYSPILIDEPKVAEAA